MRSFAHEGLRTWGVAAYVAAGLGQRDAETMVENQLWSDLRGVDTHGFQRLPWYVAWLLEGRCDPKAELTIVREQTGTLVGDAGGGLGQIAVTRFTERLIAAARRSGLVVGTLRHSNDWGCGARYPVLAAEAGFVCFATTTSVPNLAPFGSRRRLLGNNPWVFAFPRRGGPPLVLDMALTPVALGKVLRARAEGTPIPQEWGFLDRDGRPTTDPDAALRGVIPAIGGYKGIGMAVVSNLLAGVLAGSAHSADVDVGRRGQFFLLIDPGALGEPESYYRELDAMVDQFRAAKADALPGQQIWLPGEIEHGRLEQARARGTIDYPPSVVTALEETGRKLGVPFDVGGAD
jgi:L-2-hydroxycarboxylate dehydrogenase (NAD+)